MQNPYSLDKLQDRIAVLNKYLTYQEGASCDTRIVCDKSRKLRQILLKVIDLRDKTPMDPSDIDFLIDQIYDLSGTVNFNWIKRLITGLVKQKNYKSKALFMINLIEEIFENPKISDWYKLNQILPTNKFITDSDYYRELNDHIDYILAHKNVIEKIINYLKDLSSLKSQISYENLIFDTSTSKQIDQDLETINLRVENIKKKINENDKKIEKIVLKMSKANFIYGMNEITK